MKIILPLLFIMVVISQAVICYLYPYHNWDMLAYMACVVSIQEENEDAVHAITYRTAEKELPPEDFDNLTTLNDYRKQNFSDAHFFHSRLKLYWVKPLYIGFVFLLFKSGFSLTVATLLPSLLSIIILGLLLYWWIRKYTGDIVSACLSFLIILSPPFWDVGRYSTPDAMAAVPVTLGFYFILEKKNMIIGLLLLWLSSLIRIDLALLQLMTIGFLVMRRDDTFYITKMQAIFFAGLSVCTVLLISVLTGNYGDNVFDYFNPQQESWQGGLNYFGKLGKLLPQFQYSHITLFVALWLITMLSQQKMAGWKNSFLFQFGLMMISYIVVRCLIFPVLDDRYFISACLVFAVLAIKNVMAYSKDLAVKEES